MNIRIRLDGWPFPVSDTKLWLYRKYTKLKLNELSWWICILVRLSPWFAILVFLFFLSLSLIWPRIFGFWYKNKSQFRFRFYCAKHFFSALGIPFVLFCSSSKYINVYIFLPHTRSNWCTRIFTISVDIFMHHPNRIAYVRAYAWRMFIFALIKCDFYFTSFSIHLYCYINHRLVFARICWYKRRLFPAIERKWWCIWTSSKLTCLSLSLCSALATLSISVPFTKSVRRFYTRSYIWAVIVGVRRQRLESFRQLVD